MSSSSPSPKAQPSSTRNSRARTKLVVSPTSAPPSYQLANIKNQWNVERDIPSGTVRNNPFLPKPEPEKVPAPQLMHQKKQWDTRDIPRGAVAAAKAMSMEGDYDMHSPRNHSPRNLHSPRNAPRSHERNTQRPKSPQPHRPISPQKTSTKTTHLEKESRMQPKNRRSFPMASNNGATTTSLRGRLIENPFLSSSPQHQLHHPPVSSRSSPKNNWEPSREIPKRL
jgi:hypothetical protein